jgi:2-polyprenyl-3-methyl-5-hydroxy-6-metoxy-1,4-benzoquinol methylase
VVVLREVNVDQSSNWIQEMQAPPSVQRNTPRTADSPLAAIVRQSRLLAELTRTYGWSTDDQATFIHGIIASSEGSLDWRLEKILALDRRYGLNLTASRDVMVLDAGSGAGSLTIAARRMGINMVGVELDTASLELACQLAASSAVSAHDSPSLFARGDLTHLPFAPSCFPMITCHQVLEHTNDPRAMLQEMLRCLKPGGLLWLDAPDYRFCYEPHYRIPWLPSMPQALAPYWLEVFTKPLSGLSTFAYVCLPQCVQMLQALNMDILHATTTAPLTRIDEALHNLVGQIIHGHCLKDPREVRRFALRAKQSGFQPEATSFLILARKPSDHTSAT